MKPKTYFTGALSALMLISSLSAGAATATRTEAGPGWIRLDHRDEDRGLLTRGVILALESPGVFDAPVRSLSFLCSGGTFVARLATDGSWGRGPNWVIVEVGPKMTRRRIGHYGGRVVDLRRPDTMKLYRWILRYPGAPIIATAHGKDGHPQQGAGTVPQDHDALLAVAKACGVR